MWDGPSFEPSQKIRDFGVKLKLSLVRAVLEGKRVLVVDDSIGRGTTSFKSVRLKVEELISNKLKAEEIREFIECNSLAFLPFDSVQGMLGTQAPNFCYACFTGNYHVEGRIK
ncbi:hypothetical protein ACLB2K_044631 [Fragaria x ananassa]